MIAEPFLKFTDGATSVFLKERLPANSGWIETLSKNIRNIPKSLFCQDSPKSPACGYFLAWAALINPNLLRCPMKRRFSAPELFELRNTVPVDALIENVLNIPVKQSNGLFRFLCPVCNEFQTATNPATNLARCFRCERNFNPIDIVMIAKGVGFVESVNSLKRLLSTSPAHCDERRHALKEMFNRIGKPISGGAS